MKSSLLTISQHSQSHISQAIGIGWDICWHVSGGYYQSNRPRNVLNNYYVYFSEIKLGLIQMKNNSYHGISPKYNTF